jgi:uncharacterized protein (DUF952 family)
MPNPTHIYHLALPASWGTRPRDPKAPLFRDMPPYTGNPLDHQDGFIHTSTAQTIRETADLYLKHCPELILLSLRYASLAELVTWEPTPRGEFPHIFGVITATMIDAIHIIHQDQQQNFIWPTPFPFTTPA